MPPMPGAETTAQPCRSPFLEIVMASPPNVDDAASSPPATEDMSKRKRGSHGIKTGESSGPKRSHGVPSRTPRSISYGTVDPTYGQRSAIPGLDDYGTNGPDADSDLEYDIATDAISYLQGVRSEANKIPTLLVAPKASTVENGEVNRSLYNNGVGDSRGWYKDGAYTAAPEQAPSLTSTSSGDDVSERNPQTVYYKLLTERFRLLRESLKQIPPRLVVERLDADHGFHMSVSPQDYKTWRWRLQNTDPIMAQLAAMEKSTVLRLLRLIKKGSFLRRGKAGEGSFGMIRTSMWLWGLLARLPDRGELVSEEVGLVRELGKEAVWVGMRLKGMDIGSLVWEGDEDEEDLVDVEQDMMDAEADSEDVDMEDDELSASGDEEGNTSNRTASRGLPIPVKTEAPANHPMKQVSDGSRISPQATSDDTQDLRAAKARLLAHISKQPSRAGPGAETPKRAGGAEGEDDDVQFVREQTRGKAPAANEDHAKALLNTRATIDMVITVAGEMYGQRDLLEFRHLWAEEGGDA